MKLLDNFKAFLIEIENFEKGSSLMSWDLHTITPKNGVDSMVEGLSFFSERAFEKQVSDQMGKYLLELCREDNFKELDIIWQKAVKKLKKDYDEYKNVPVKFYGEYSRLIAKSEDVWQNAKRENDYDLFRPYLEKIIKMTKEMCGYRRPGNDVYNTLLDDYEKSMDGDTIDVLFNEIKEELIPFVKEIIKKGLKKSPKFKGVFPKAKQVELSKFLLEYIGFDMNAGYMAESEHPFTLNLSKEDVRLTNHYDENDLICGIFSIIHEGGHGIFEQNVSDKYSHTPFKSCEYMGLHESQSRFYENILGRNINFWIPIYDKVKELFPQFNDISLEEFYQEINLVQNSLIRIEADEVTYCFHIIIRYEIEKMIFNNEITVDELPKVWNEKMSEYLGVIPETYSDGVLQDTHWSGGSFGYFPSYLLGSIYDGMILDKITEDLGDIDIILREGRIREITKWLNEKIHIHGCYYEPRQLIKELFDKDVTSEPLIRYFKNKYKKFI